LRDDESSYGGGTIIDDAFKAVRPSFWTSARQLAEHKTEPNSGLGKAISYLLNHWPKLTLFLRQPGAPIDNNIAERALKKAILNRRNYRETLARLATPAAA